MRDFASELSHLGRGAGPGTYFTGLDHGSMTLLAVWWPLLDAVAAPLFRDHDQGSPSFNSSFLQFKLGRCS